MRYGADRDPDRRHERLDLDATRDEFGAEILIPRDIPVVGWVRHDSDRHLVSVTMYAEPGPGRVVVVPDHHELLVVGAPGAYAHVEQHLSAALLELLAQVPVLRGEEPGLVQV